MFRAWLSLLAVVVLGTTLVTASGALPSAGLAQVPSLELTFTPIDRAQIAVWVEREDGTFMGTLALTYAVAKAGIGNRPGALQMNSGFRWPYGRREGVLPVWAHRRASAPGASQWKRVIFQDRNSEGFASRTSNDQSADNYYCLSFKRDTTGRDALDAVTCASVFSSDKGRYATDQDTRSGYAEPFESAAGVGSMRPLSVESLYPPRRDVERCTTGSCYDHRDVEDYRRHALEVMPELDAVTRATLQGKRPAQWNFALPSDWPRDVAYKLFVEVNVEGDYNDGFNERVYPTPKQPENSWDSWAEDFGYPYRGQPSVVYSIDFMLDTSNDAGTLEPVGYGSVHGDTGELAPMGPAISNDSKSRQGSGADRLLRTGDVRASVRVVMPDSEYCRDTSPPGAVQALKVARYPDSRHAHNWARLSFRTPESDRQVGSYQIEIRAEGKDWEQAYTPDSEEELLPVALDICADPTLPGVDRCRDLPAGSELSVTLSGLMQLTRYEVRVRARDRECGATGELASAQFSTPERKFATVSPCFVASAAYGSPLASQVGVLRTVRDRYLAPTEVGRAFIDFYYSVGPSLAKPVRDYPWLASMVRGVLTPVVWLAAWWVEE